MVQLHIDFLLRDVKLISFITIIIVNDNYITVVIYIYHFYLYYSSIDDIPSFKSAVNRNVEFFNDSRNVRICLIKFIFSFSI